MASQTPRAKLANVDGSTAIDDDVLYEIMLSLPAKPLCRLRAVCRSWRSLLSAPSFIAAHKARQAAPLLVVRDREDDGSTVNVHILDISSGEVVKRILTSRSTWRFPKLPVLMRAPHDLALAHLPGTDDGRLRLRVLDTVSGVDFALPDVDHDKRQRHSAWFTFGRVSTGDYKALCLTTCTSLPNRQQLCKVLTLSGNHRWRETGCPPAKVRTCPRDGAAVNGVAYFLLSTAYDDPAGSKGCIMAYDLEKEVWRPAALPAPVPSKRHPQAHQGHILDIGLTELGGCLALVYQDRRAFMMYKDGRAFMMYKDGRAFMELWLLVDPDKVTWSKRCTVTVPYPYQGVGYLGGALVVAR